MADPKTNSWKEFFSTDPDWIKAKVTAAKEEDARIISRLEYLRKVGADLYREENYLKYKKQKESSGDQLELIK